MTLELENFEEVRIKGEEFYRNLTEVHCPYLKEKVAFNAQGLEHLKFKEPRKARPQQDQYMRLKLVHLAPVVIGSSATLRGIWETKNFERVRVHNRTDVTLMDVTYYEFVAVVEKIRVKVIVKRIAQGGFFSGVSFRIGESTRGQTSGNSIVATQSRISEKGDKKTAILAGSLWVFGYSLCISRERANPPNT